MKYIVCYILTSIWGILVAVGNISVTRDSLLNVVKVSSDLSCRVTAYRNLADLYFEKPEEADFLNKMYFTAKEAGDKAQVFDALSDLAFLYTKAYHADSALYYMRLLEKSGTPEETLPHLSLLRMRLFEGRVRNNETETAIAEELAFVNKKGVDKKNIYIQMEQAYTTGCALCSESKYKEANPYLETAYNLACQLPYKEGFKFRACTVWNFLSTLSFMDQKGRYIACVEDLLRQYEKYYELYYARQRPFYNINVRYLQCYTSLLMRADQLSDQQAEYYYNQIVGMRSQITEPIDKYNYFLGMNNYYLHKHEYDKALKTNDSLIKYAWIISPSNVPDLLDVNSQIYEAMGDYENAFKHHKFHMQVKDSINSASLEEQLGELQVKYEVDKLHNENCRLEMKNRLILVITLFIVLLLVTGICCYLFYTLKRERRMKKMLGELNKKVGESEKMKTAFINSMCHEIRTPLNAIVGFSGIITDMTIEDEKAKKEYYTLITANAEILASLIDHLLIVANLDSSDASLPCEPANVSNVCRQEMGKLEQWAKPGVTYRMELPEDEISVSTNEQYLSLVIENLLNNANKFTDTGTITLKMRLDKTQGTLRIEVADTGCGIPSEKREEVFQRFTKLDEFAQGNGLGLYLSRLIIKRLSGSIFIDPDYTEGTRMVIDLPL